MVSVIIPTLDEGRRIGGCLRCVLAQASGVGAEVLVVDGGSRDGTRGIVRRTPGVRLLDAPRGRGKQMNVGARRARGSLLVFLPADTLLSAGAMGRLAEVDRAGTPAAGGFRQRFDAPRRFLRLVSFLHNLRARVTGVIYGDQVPFVRRELFLDLGGFPEGVDMEDVRFGARLRKRVRPVLLDLKIVTSSRRFDRAGDLRATAEALWILLHWVLARRVPRSRTFFTPVR